MVWCRLFAIRVVFVVGKNVSNLYATKVAIFCHTPKKWLSLWVWRPLQTAPQFDLLIGEPILHIENYD